MSLRETADLYPHIVVMLNSNWRVIRCADGLQWILQRRGSPEKPRRDDWRGRSYCRTRDVLIRCAREYSGPIDPAASAALEALPARIQAVADADLPPRRLPDAAQAAIV
jgi:hypothetical protein